MKVLLPISALLALTNCIVTAHFSKHIVKAFYQPYGTLMCRDVSDNCTDTLIYTKEDLSCRRISGNVTVTQPSTETSISTMLMEDAVRRSIENGSHKDQFPMRSSHYDRHFDRHEANTLSRQFYIRAMHQACQQGNVCLVWHILTQRLADINCRGVRGFTPVMTAVHAGQMLVFNYLVHMGSDLTTKDYDHNNLLHIACSVGNLPAVRELTVTHQFDINERGWFKMTPVMYASSFGHTEVIGFLLSESCNRMMVDEHNNNLLHIACIVGVASTVKYILEHDVVGIDSKGNAGRTPVMLAAVKGHMAVVDLLIGKSCNLKATDIQENNILHLACTSDNVVMVKYFLKLDILNIDSRGFRGRTPAMLAAEYGHLNILELLISKNSNVTSTDNDGNNILFAAIRGRVINMVKYIIGQNLVSLQSRGFLGKTPLLEAAQNGNIAIVDFLLSRKCDMNATDDKGSNVLHYACVGGNVRMVKHVIELDVVSIDSGGHRGRTPLMTAAVRGHRHVFRLLLSKNCDIEAVDRGGNNVLHMACVAGDIVIVKTIIKLGVGKLNVKNKSGLTPRQIAKKKGHKAVVGLLRAN